MSVKNFIVYYHFPFASNKVICFLCNWMIMFVSRISFKNYYMSYTMVSCISKCISSSQHFVKKLTLCIFYWTYIFFSNNFHFFISPIIYLMFSSKYGRTQGPPLQAPTDIYLLYQLSLAILLSHFFLPYVQCLL